MPEIVGTPGKIDEVTKRLYVPGVAIKDTCPNCGKACEVNLDTVCLYYPTLNAPMKFSMYCCEDSGGCEHEWSFNIIMRVQLEIETP